MWWMVCVNSMRPCLMTPMEDTVSLFSTHSSEKQCKQTWIPEHIPGSNKMGLDTFPGKSLFEWFGQGLMLICYQNLIPDCVQPPPPSIMVDDEPEFEISKILNSKIDN